MNSIKCFYIWDDKLIQECDRLPSVLGRASIVHSLIAAYNLHKHMTVVQSQPATYEEMREFHSNLYLDYLKAFRGIEDDYITSEQDEEFGLGYDCAPVSNMYELVSTIAGGSVVAAKALTRGLADVAINWCGGWHHASRFGAEGFCYVNDIVIAIEILRLKFPKVLYIDLDVHHGNGVQDAYNISTSVFTLSIHKLETGFYPGTGSLEDIGCLYGKGYAVNFPLHGAYSDSTLTYAFESTFQLVYDYFKPDAIVVQCGADCLAHDPSGGATVTSGGYCRCVRKVLDKRKPTMLLGGGGYKSTNAARLWASITALVLDVDLDENIPDHRYFTEYRPDYMLGVEATLARDPNKKTYLDHCINTIKGNLEKYLGNNYETSAKKVKNEDTINRKDNIQTTEENIEITIGI